MLLVDVGLVFICVCCFTLFVYHFFVGLAADAVLAEADVVPDVNAWDLGLSGLNICDR